MACNLDEITKTRDSFMSSTFVNTVRLIKRQVMRSKSTRGRLSNVQEREEVPMAKALSAKSKAIFD